MKIDILTLFPEMFKALEASILGKAKEKNLIDFSCHNIRDYSLDKHKKVDDYPFGGGAGMVMMAQPIFDCLDSVEAKNKKIVYMSPKGSILNEEKVRELAQVEDLVILCGHYEGVDERVFEAYEIEEISIGDYILTGGEPAAIVLIDSIARLVPNVLGNHDSINEESIYSGLLEYPHYTKPREFRGYSVPEVLLNGNHKLIDQWKMDKSLEITKTRRPDLYDEYMKKE